MWVAHAEFPFALPQYWAEPSTNPRLQRDDRESPISAPMRPVNRRTTPCRMPDMHSVGQSPAACGVEVYVGRQRDATPLLAGESLVVRSGTRNRRFDQLKEES